MRPPEERPRALDEGVRRRAVTLVERDLRLGEERIPVLDVIAARRPATLRLRDLVPRARRLVVEQPRGVGETRAQRRRRVHRAAIVGLAQPLGRRDPKARQLTEVVEALE